MAMPTQSPEHRGSWFKIYVIWKHFNDENTNIELLLSVFWYNVWLIFNVLCNYVDEKNCSSKNI